MQAVFDGLVARFGRAGHAAIRVSTTARCTWKKTRRGFPFPQSTWNAEADVPVIEEEEFHKLADDAKENCPVSRLLKGSATITLKARLLR